MNPHREELLVLYERIYKLEFKLLIAIQVLERIADPRAFDTGLMDIAQTALDMIRMRAEKLNPPGVDLTE